MVGDDKSWFPMAIHKLGLVIDTVKGKDVGVPRIYSS